jgi:hypothetical protein
MRIVEEKVLLGHESGHATTEIDSSSDEKRVRMLVRLIAVSMTTLVGVDVLLGCMLPAAIHVGRSQTSRKPVRLTDDVESVRFCGASGMPYGRDCRRYAASHRAGGDYGCLPAQLMWFGQAETVRSGAPVDSAVPSCDVTTVQGGSERCAGMVQTGCGSSSDSCWRTRQDGGCAVWLSAPQPEKQDVGPVQLQEMASGRMFTGGLARFKAQSRDRWGKTR